MRVKVRSVLDLKDILGEGEIEFLLHDGTTIKGLFEEMNNRWGDDLASQLFEPDSLNVLPHIMIMTNGRNIEFLDRMGTVLRDGDEVFILPPIGGG